MFVQKCWLGSRAAGGVRAQPCLSPAHNHIALHRSNRTAPHRTPLHPSAPHCLLPLSVRQVEVHEGPAAATLDALLAQEGQAGSYDFAFVDADKRGYRAYHEQLVQVGLAWSSLRVSYSGRVSLVKPNLVWPGLA